VDNAQCLLESMITLSLAFGSNDSETVQYN